MTANQSRSVGSIASVRTRRRRAVASDYHANIWKVRSCRDWRVVEPSRSPRFPGLAGGIASHRIASRSERLARVANAKQHVASCLLTSLTSGGLWSMSRRCDTPVKERCSEVVSERSSSNAEDHPTRFLSPAGRREGVAPTILEANFAVNTERPVDTSRTT